MAHARSHRLTLAEETFVGLCRSLTQEGEFARNLSLAAPLSRTEATAAEATQAEA